MVKTSDFDSENPGSSPGEAAKLVAAYDELMKKADFIVSGAPFHMGIGEDEYARISISGDTATLTWPEMESGYYNDSYMQRQSVSFPAELLLWPMDALNHWKAEEIRKHEADQAAKSRAYAAQRAAEQERNERAALAMLKAKYGG